MKKLIAKLFIWTLVSTTIVITSATAHEMRPAVADVRVSQSELTIEVELALESLIAGIDGAKFSDTNDAPEASEYDRLRALNADDLGDELSANLDRVTAYFVIENGSGADWTLVNVSIPEPGDIELPRDSRLTISTALDGVGPVSVGGARELGGLILRHVEAGENAFEGLLSPGELSPSLPRSGGAAESAFDTFVRYIVLGVEHIVPKGLDHILFVLGLFFFASAWRPLLWQVTAFTAAHTVTLAIASAGLITISASIVEPLIAASIVYVAVENLRSDGRIGRMRMAVVFGFGLLHGLGFASVLGEIGLGQGRFLVSLIGFNIGVEIGQLLVIAAAFVLLGFWFGHKPYYKRWIAGPISILIALIGAWWVIERVFL